MYDSLQLSLLSPLLNVYFFGIVLCVVVWDVFSKQFYICFILIYISYIFNVEDQLYES